MEQDDFFEDDNMDEPESFDLQDERMDNEDDRSYSHILVGKKLRGLYQDGWQEGRIDYYNKKLKQLHLKFQDSSEDDYVNESDIDGVELMLV